jgi:hypothetical protein
MVKDSKSDSKLKKLSKFLVMSKSHGLPSNLKQVLTDTLPELVM